MRKIKSQKTKELFLFFVLFTYIIFSSVYGLLSPFLGVIYCYFIFNLKYLEIKKKYFYLLLVFTILFEVNHGFFMFSSFATFILLYFMFIDENNPKQYNLKSLIFGFIVLSYIFFYYFNYLLSYLFGLEYPVLGFHYIQYIIIDFLIALVLFL
ncbi:MAG: Unknown protein [uncultured Campylobacterales bacterium]|uniref:Uncharacterized protein n=1 Tax=uncultured Campylobacterales bacterium TaxID=352960 RepID=A0A6S6SPH1_9BACT|nr:MAG: Unknown protein [uncultured Campylobacterales bacterium]